MNFDRSLVDASGNEQSTITNEDQIELGQTSFPLEPSRNQPNTILAETEPPNGGYGWVCTACAFLVNAQTWGVNSTWSVFLAYFLSNSTFKDATKFQMSIIGGLSISQCLLISPIVTVAKRRLGLRVVMVLGTVLISTALLTSSFANKIWHLCLSQGVLFGWGMGFLYLPALSTLPAWFSSRRSLAGGIAASGAGMGGLLYNLAAGQAVQSIGVAKTYRIFALVSLAANMVCALMMKECSAGSSEASRGYFVLIHEFKQLGLLFIALWGIMTEFGYITLLYSLPTYATSINLNTQQGSIISAMLNLGLVVGRPVVGYVSDRYGRINVSMSMTGLCGIFCLALWIPATSYISLVLFAIISGMVCGTFWSSVGAVIAEVVGVHRVSPAFSVICIMLVAPTTFAEPVALSLSSNSSYQGTQVFVACMFLAGSVCLWLLRSWQMFMIESKSRMEDASLSHREVPLIVAYLNWISLRKLVRNGHV